MAKKSKCSKQALEHHVSVSFNFDGIIKSDVRGCLIIELLKYLLYERQQLPLTFDHVKRDLFKHFSNKNDEKGNERKRHMTTVKELEYKKVSKVIEELETLFSHICTSFECHPEIQEILLVLGSTVVSPKESFYITFPQICPESDGLSRKACVTSLIKQMIVQDIVCTWRNISCTNLQFLLKAHRHCGIAWFVPKPHFKPSPRGRHCTINLETNEKHRTYGSGDLTYEADVEISGIEPFDMSDFSNFSLSESSTVDMDGSEEMTSGSSLMNSVSQDDCRHTDLSQTSNRGDEENYIWFQAPIKMKGYKAKNKGIHH